MDGLTFHLLARMKLNNGWKIDPFIRVYDFSGMHNQTQDNARVYK